MYPETAKQVIPDNQLVAGIAKVKPHLWNNHNKRNLDAYIEADKKNTIDAIYELPLFEQHVRKYEILWKKQRQDFNVLEREQIDRTYITK